MEVEDTAHATEARVPDGSFEPQLDLPALFAQPAAISKKASYVAEGKA